MQDRPRPFAEHLRELRRRLWYSAATFVAGTALAMIFYRPILKVLLYPAHGYLSPTNKPIFTEPTELLGVTLKAAFMGGFALALPMFVYQIVMFVSPALSQRARRRLLLLVPAAVLAFAAGVAFGYFVMLPPLLGFSLTFGADIATPMIRINEYVNLVTTLLLGIGLTFETPLVMYILATVGVVNYRQFAKLRRYIIVLGFVIGAIFDPSPNPLDQIFFAVCFITLYEIGIWLSWLVRPREQRSHTVVLPS